MTRPQAVAVVLAFAAALGVTAYVKLAAVPAPRSPGCPDGGVLRKGADGALTCGEGAALRPGEALTVRQKFDCNSASAEELAAVLGATLARRFVEARDGGFQSWEQVDAVPGLGPERLLKLQAACEIRVADGGVW